MKKLLIILTILTLIPSFALADITSNLEGQWKFNEGTGTSAVDSVSANNGTLEGSAGWAAGQIGTNSVSLVRATSDDVYINGATGYDGGNITVAIWLKFTALGNTEYMFTKASDVTDSWYLFKNTSDVVNFGVRGADNSFNVSANYTLTDTNWHHYVGVYDGSNVYLYVDGTAIGSPTAYSGSVKDSIFPVCVGSYGASSGTLACQKGLYYGGLADEARIYTRALSSSDVSELYAYTEGGGAAAVVPPKIQFNGSYQFRGSYNF